MTTTTSDPYAILGVPNDATTTAIKSAYRKLALQTHPDKIQDESLRAIKQDEFHRLQQAYEILTDETRRREHDEKVNFAAAAADKRDYFGDRFRSSTTDAGIRVEVRTAAPPRDFDPVYEERRPSRRSDDEEILGIRRDFRVYEERVTAKVYEGGSERRRTARGLDDQRRAARTAEEEVDRIRLHRDRERQNEREHQSERRRTRARDRRRGYDQKYYNYDIEFDVDDDGIDVDLDDDELGVPRVSIHIDPDVGVTRSRKKTTGEARHSDDMVTPRRQQPFVRRTSDDAADTHRKLSLAREYMDDRSGGGGGGGSMRTPRLHRSTTTTAAAMTTPVVSTAATVVTSGSSSTAYEVRPISPPVEEEIIVDTVRRSSAAPRRSADRDRGSRRSRPSRRESAREIEIVEPAATSDYETRSSMRGTPSMVHSSSSPANIRMPTASGRVGPSPHRSATMQSTREIRPEPPSLSRSSTMPTAGLGLSSSSSSRRRGDREREREREPYSAASSSRLKPTVTEIDSGYSSPGTPETPTTSRPSKSRTRHASEYTVFEDLEPRYPRESSGRHRRVVVETSDLGYDRRETTHDRSVSPHGRSPKFTDETTPIRPSLAGRPSTSAKLSSPSTRTTSYVFNRKDGSSTRLESSPSTPAAATTPFLRRESSANVPSSSSRASSSSTVRPDPPMSGSGSGSRSRTLFGEVQFSPRITPEHIRFSESRTAAAASHSSRDRDHHHSSSSASHHHRRGNSSATVEAAYRDAAPPRSRSHYLHGPHSGLMRAETSM
ncbi:MAG: GTPase-activating protein [Watsoniomyces obsoletus]|nr:MAG: GTPase-activating protein [Watsoniomyces obsoletus]